MTLQPPLRGPEPDYAHLPGVILWLNMRESETLLFGTGFGVATDIRTGPNGNLFIVSLTNGEIYEIFRKK